MKIAKSLQRVLLGSAFLMINTSIVNAQYSVPPEWESFRAELSAIISSDVKNELELLDDQRETLPGIYHKGWNKLRVLNDNLRNNPMIDREATIADGNKIIEETRREFGEKALKHQQVRLTQVANQQRAFYMDGLKVKLVQGDLELSESDASSLQEVNDEYEKKFLKMRREFENETKELFAKRMNKIKSKLKSSQRKKFDSYYGDVFFPLMKITLFILRK